MFPRPINHLTNKDTTYNKKKIKGDEQPKTAHIYLNSQDKMSGTNDNATFKVNMPCDLKTDKLNLSLVNFIPTYPTNVAGGIVSVNLLGADTPYTYSSSNQNTHSTLGVFPLSDGRLLEYPPSAMTANTTNITGQSYGNGNYTASITSAQNGQAWNAFNKQYDGFLVRTAFCNENIYNSITGFYAGTASNSTTMSGSNYFGEHLTIVLPSNIILTRYDYTSHIEPLTRCGNTWVVGGSTDGINWTLLDTRSNVFWTTSNETQSFFLSNNTIPFNNYRMLVTRVGNSNQPQYREDCGIAEWRLFGYNNSAQVGLTTISTSNFTTSPVNAFDYNSNTSWRTGSVYNSSNGVYSGTNSTLVDGSNMTGEWIELQTAQQINLQNYTIVADANALTVPNTFTMAVSSNGTNYTRLHTQSNINDWTAPWVKTFNNSNLPASNAYNRYRILTHTVGNSGSSGRSNVGIAEIRLNGFSNVGTDLTPFFIPPQPLTTTSSNQTGQPMGNGTYTTSASTGSTTPSWNAFDYNLGGTVWTTSNLYNSTTGFYEGSNFTDVAGSNFTGEWVQIQTPYPVYLSFYDIACSSSNTSINTLSLVGSTNGSNFALIHTIPYVGDWGTGISYKNYTSCNNIPTPEPYTHWRLIVHRVGNSNISNGRTRPSIEVWQPRGYSSNRPYNFPPSSMTSTTTTFSNLLTLANGSYTVSSSSNTVTFSNTILPTRLGQCNLNCEVITTDKTMFNRPITLQLSSPTGTALSNIGNWSCQIAVKEMK